MPTKVTATKKTEGRHQLLSQVIAKQNNRARQNIDLWRQAQKRAENVEKPRRNQINNLYDEITLDSHLSSEIQKRILAITGGAFTLNNTEGDIDDEKTAMFKKPWFYKAMHLAMESIFYGHRLIQIGDLNEKKEISNVSIIPPNHVVPEFGTFLKQETDEEGVQYREDPLIYGYLLEVGDNHNLGLLNKCVPHVLYKRFAQAAYSEYTEIFGMPVRVGKTNTKDERALNNMEQMLINMGTAGWSVIDIDDQLELLQGTDGKGDVYSNLMRFCNNELSENVNGAIIGGDSKGGSRSKEEVGERIVGAITMADKQFIESWVNYNVIPKLIGLGYPLEGFTFNFAEQKDLKEAWTIAQGLLNHYDIEPEWINSTFGIPVIPKKVPTATPADNLSNSANFFG